MRQLGRPWPRLWRPRSIVSVSESQTSKSSSSKSRRTPCSAFAAAMRESGPECVRYKHAPSARHAGLRPRPRRHDVAPRRLLEPTPAPERRSRPAGRVLIETRRVSTGSARTAGVGIVSVAPPGATRRRRLRPRLLLMPPAMPRPERARRSGPRVTSPRTPAVPRPVGIARDHDAGVGNRLAPRRLTNARSAPQARPRRKR